MKDFLNSLSDCILVVSKKGNIQFVNEELIRRLGITTENVKDISLRNIFNDDELVKCILESEINNIKAPIKLSCRKVTNVNLYISENNWCNENSLFITIKEDKTASCDINQMGICIENQSEIEQLRDEIRRSKEAEDELEELLSTAMDIMSITADGGKIVKVNEEASRILGWTREELHNMKWIDMMDPQDAKDCYESMIGHTTNVDDNVKSSIYKYKNKWGKAVWLEWRFRYNNEKKVMFSTAKDISEYKKLESDRVEYEKAFHMESVKNEFFANISHEFKTPLNIILGTMQVIELRIDNGTLKVSGDVEFNKYTGSIVQNSYRLLKLVNNLIDITKIDTGFYNLALENRNIISVIEDITMSVAEYMKNKGIELVFDTEIEEVIIACDLEKIERIMLNLLSNAIKYVGKQGKIIVLIKASSGFVIVSVKDNGIGIPKEKLGNIFERFIQVDNTLTRKYEGSGIGLSLVKGLIDLHGGEISVDSAEGKGAEFIFTLPIKVTDNPICYLKNNSKSRIEKCNIEFSDIYK